MSTTTASPTPSGTTPATTGSAQLATFWLDGDRVTADATPTIRGSGPAGTMLKLQHNGADLADVRTDASGNWSHTMAALADGTHSFAVRADDGGTPSPILSITVDTTGPGVTASPDGALHLDPDGDLQISAAMRLHLARTVFRRAVAALAPESGLGPIQEIAA